MTRSDKVARAQALRADGKLLREIAAEMGVAISTVDAWLNDPDGARLRARKDSYRGTCEECGAPTDGSNGRGGAPKRCRECAPDAIGTRVGRGRILRGRNRHSDDAILAALQRLARDGVAPGRKRYDREHVCGAEPSSPVVLRRFGSWLAAVEAAGLRPARGVFRSYSGFSRADCIAAIRACARHIGDPTRVPLYREYEEWQKSQPDAPSGTSLRNICGPWIDVAVEAVAEQEAIAA